VASDIISWYSTSTGQHAVYANQQLHPFHTEKVATNAIAHAGEGRVHECLRQHTAQLSPDCRKEELHLTIMQAQVGFLMQPGLAQENHPDSHLIDHGHMHAEQHPPAQQHLHKKCHPVLSDASGGNEYCINYAVGSHCRMCGCGPSCESCAPRRLQCTAAMSSQVQPVWPPAPSVHRLTDCKTTGCMLRLHCTTMSQSQLACGNYAGTHVENTRHMFNPSCRSGPHHAVPAGEPDAARLWTGVPGASRHA
jgi:hypothetical protein